MTSRRFYIAFAILGLFTFLTLAIWGLAVASPILKKLRISSEPKIKLEKPTFLASDQTTGPEESAKLKITVFGDFLCPISKETSDVLSKIMSDYPANVRLVWKDFPNTTLHPEAVVLAIAAECAGTQGKFWEYHDLLFKNQGAINDPALLKLADNLKINRADFAKCLSSKEALAEVQRDFEEGKALKITGTPYLFINDTIKLDGAIKYEELEEFLK